MTIHSVTLETCDYIVWHLTAYDYFLSHNSLTVFFAENGDQVKVVQESNAVEFDVDVNEFGKHALKSSQKVYSKSSIGAAQITLPICLLGNI